jgi:curved DNA-binding protein CbpA
MTPQNNLDHSGDLRVNPFAELLVEIVQARLTGSLRISRDVKKTIIYFRDGRVVFAVSNVREHRLFHRLLKEKRVTQSDLRDCPGLGNDMELSAWLQNKGLMNAGDVSDAFISQIGDIIVDALTWPDGQWIFSASARLRSDVDHKIEIYKLLLDYARCIPGEKVMSRFRSVQEAFVRQLDVFDDLLLNPHEACVLEAFGNTPLRFDQLRESLHIPESSLAEALYCLWLGGVLARVGWNKAFSDAKVSEIKTARLSKVKDAAPVTGVKDRLSAPVASEAATDITPQPEKASIPEISLDEWLKRVDEAETHYDILGLDDKAPTEDIKNAYFGMAKLFHPDRYHRESADQLRRIEVAFTGLAQAYETLKTPESREAYNYKIRKELEAREKRVAAGIEDDGGQSEQALESFEQGLRYLNEEEFGAAAAYLARAVHYNPNNALYRAYFGKALSADDKQLHKAESEMQAAAKLEPQNAKIRLMLAQFFIDRNMKKRAEGELTRFLEMAPDNREARTLLDGLLR